MLDSELRVEGEECSLSFLLLPRAGRRRELLARLGRRGMSAVGEIMVRMGELAVSSTPGDVLVSIGLGSCIGLALVDRAAASRGWRT